MNLKTKISLVLIAVGSIFLFLDVLVARSKNISSEIDNFSYEIDGNPHDLGEVSGICDILGKRYGEVRILILVTPNALRGYQNVFQTSDANAGIRLEIDENGSTGVIVAGDTPDQFVAAVSPSRVSVGKQSTISLLIAHDTGVTISIDDQSSRVIGVVKPLCDRLRIGVGFDDTRSFDGTGSITIVTGLNKPPFSIPKSTKTFGQILLILGSIMWAVGDTFTRTDKTPSD